MSSQPLTCQEKGVLFQAFLAYILIPVSVFLVLVSLTTCVSHPEAEEIRQEMSTVRAQLAGDVDVEKVEGKLADLEARIERMDTRVDQEVGWFGGVQQIGTFAGGGFYMLLVTALVVLTAAGLVFYQMRKRSKLHKALLAVRDGLDGWGDDASVQSMVEGVKQCGRSRGVERELTQFLAGKG